MLSIAGWVLQLCLRLNPCPGRAANCTFFKGGNWGNEVHFPVQTFRLDRGSFSAADQEPKHFDCGKELQAAHWPLLLLCPEGKGFALVLQPILVSGVGDLHVTTVITNQERLLNWYQWPSSPSLGGGGGLPKRWDVFLPSLTFV